MKKIILLLFFTFSISAFSQDKIAKVQKVNDVNVFAFSEPINEYVVLGDFNIGLRNKDYIVMVKEATEKAKKLYPNCNGIVVEIAKVLGSIRIKVIELK